MPTTILKQNSIFINSVFTQMVWITTLFHSKCIQHPKFKIGGQTNQKHCSHLYFAVRFDLYEEYPK